ncbi:MAG: DUF1501 domain-containing protein [Deltaproteobacteria bacterium]|nr:DUF1501 domain-containing protein [Deltaproteobacteria bacterium]
MERATYRRALLWLFGAALLCAIRGDAVAQVPQGTGKVIVLVELKGGADGLSIAIPYTSGVYYARRPTIGIGPNDVFPLGNGVGLHGELNQLKTQSWDEGRLAVIQQVGFPTPASTHEEAMKVWRYGRRDTSRGDGRGWIGRLTDQYFDSHFDVFGIGVARTDLFNTARAQVKPTLVEYLGNIGFSWDWSSSSDGEMRGDTAHVLAVSSSNPGGARSWTKDVLARMHGLEDGLWDINSDYTSNIGYPGSSIGYNLRDAAKLIQRSPNTQVIYVSMSGFDMHSDSRTRMRDRLSELDDSFSAFIRDLKAMGKWSTTAVLVFSEFGRSNFENATGGTEDGHGNNLLLFGGSVAGGVYGPTPGDAELQADTLAAAIDFRSVLKTIIQSHLGLDPNPIFLEPIPGDAILPLF